ncbi:MAG TPA: hypothetical protein VF665_08765 [Longimicrobium sp.]|jgi:hypothetical protein|uniref:hypothetical protein n=1 Tax=Longimicrobium sp. TaxID=2029185 RepID=UPI002ED99D11
MTDASANLPMAGTPTGTVTTAADGTLSVLFGLQFLIDGKPVTISSADIANAATKGIEFAIPGPLDLGTLANLISWINTTFSVNIPSGDSLPSPLNEVVNVLTNIDFTVTEFHIKIPPKGSSDTVQYTLALTATLASPINLIPGSEALKITGALVGVSNEAQPAPALPA